MISNIFQLFIPFSMEIDDNLTQLLLLYLLARRRRKRRRSTIRDFFKLRPLYGEFSRTVWRLSLPENQDLFFKYFRMLKVDYDFILDKIRPEISKANTHPTPIPPEERLALTLKVLATGQTFVSVGIRYHIHPSAVGRIFIDTCQAIFKQLKDDFLKVPSSEAEWSKIREDFYTQWQFPNCIGAIDGKHIRIKAPAKSGGNYRNFKGFFSMVLLAIADATYKFIMIDIGSYGRQSDGGTFSHSRIGQKFESKSFTFAEKSKLPHSDTICNNVLLGDEAFPLKSYLLRPYPGRYLPYDERIFNYRLSRACRVVENAFGILVRRWSILSKTIELKPKNVDVVVAVCACLHNFCITRRGDLYMNVPMDIGHDRSDHLAGNRAKIQAENLRDRFKHYFSSEAGRVIWQDDMI